MATEKYTNDFTTTLNGAIDNVTATVVVHDASGFPSAGNFRIRVEDEYMIVTAVASNTLTVTRHAEGSSATSHADGTSVAAVLTAGALDAIRGDLVTSTTFATRPAAGKNGNLHLASDGPYLSRDDGSAWSAFGPISRLYPVVTGDFAWLNQGSATETVLGGAVLLAAESGRGSPSVAARIKSPAAAPWTATICFHQQFKPNSAGGTVNAMAGLVAYEAGTTKMISFGMFQTDTPNRLVSFAQSSGPTSGFSTVTNIVISVSSPIWFQLSNDGTNLIWRYSTNGYTFHQVSSEALTSHFTTAPDKVGYFVNQDDSRMVLYSWKDS